MSEAQPSGAQVLEKACFRAARDLGLPWVELAMLLCAEDAPLEAFEERALLVVRCWRALEVLVSGNATHRDAWLSTYNHALRGIPRERIRSVHGLREVVCLLEQPREGS